MQERKPSGQPTSPVSVSWARSQHVTDNSSLHPPSGPVSPRALFLSHLQARELRSSEHKPFPGEWQRCPASRDQGKASGNHAERTMCTGHIAHMEKSILRVWSSPGSCSLSYSAGDNCHPLLGEQFVRVSAVNCICLPRSETCPLWLKHTGA